MSDSEGASDSADSDAPAFVPKQKDNKYGPPKSPRPAPAEEEHIDALLEEDADEIAAKETAAKEERRLQEEAVARAAAWDRAKKAAAEERRKKEEEEREHKLREAQAQAGAGRVTGDRPEHESLDEEGFPVYSPHALEAMETGQIVLQFLKCEDVKPANLYMQAKLLSPTKELLHETEVIKKTSPPDWSAWPPTIHNVKDAGNSILKFQVVQKSALIGALDTIVGEVVIKVNELAPGVPYTRWYEFGLKEKDADKARLQKKKGHLGKVLVNLMYFNINSKFLKTEFTHPIHTLIRKRYVDGVFHLIEKEKITADTQDGEGNTCLHVAAECDVPEVVPLLLQIGHNPKQVNSRDQTPLHLAAGHSAKTCRILLDRGANVMADDKDGDLPIHYAARFNNGDAVEMLVKAKTDPNVKSKRGDLPFTLAVSNNCPRAIRALAACNADPFLVNSEGVCAADVFFTRKEKLGGGGQVLVADGAERNVHEETTQALMEAFDCDDPREFLCMRHGFRKKHKLIGSRITHVFSTRSQQWTVHCDKATTINAIVHFAQSKGLQNEKISFVVVARNYPTVYRHPSSVQNVVCYGEEDPVNIAMDPSMYYTFIPYTKHPELKGDFSVILYSKRDTVLDTVELREWPYGDQIESEWKGASAGGAQPNETWDKNPRFVLRVNRKRTDVQVAIMLQQPRLATDMIPFQVQQYSNHIGFYVYEGDRLVDKIAQSADSWLNGREVWTQVTLDGTKTPKILILPTTYNPGVEKAFTIKVMCNHKCRLNQLDASGKDIARDDPKKTVKGKK